MNIGLLSETLDKTVKTLSALVPEKLQRPRVGIVCGSGLSGLVELFREAVIIPYGNLEGFATSTVPGHRSDLVLGLLGSGEGLPAIAMLGRFHPYEGHPFHAVVYPIRVMARMGVKNIIITNATGSLNPSLSVGTIVAIRDHLALPNMCGFNPLLGKQLSMEYPRFLPLSDAYSPALRRLFFLAAHELGLSDDAVVEGTYAWVSGPTYESPAEGRFLRNAGADVVGMSTIPEVVVAREEEMNVIVISLVTNKVIIPDQYRSIKAEVKAELAGKVVTSQAMEIVSHAEVLAEGQKAAGVMKQLVEKIVEQIPSVQELQ